MKYIRLGDITLSGQYGTARDFDIIRRIAHPEFKPPIIYNDIALLEMDRPVRFNQYIQPACLFKKYDVGDLNITGSGWGVLEHGGVQSNVLQYGVLNFFTLDECAKAYKTFKRRAPNGVIDDKQICFGGKEREVDTCQGDSGGPLQWKMEEDDFYRVIGVTSIGKGCGIINVPAIYTRVAYYIPWIENIVFK